VAPRPASGGTRDPLNEVVTLNKALGQTIRGALILGTVLLSAQAGLAQVAGRVTTGDGTAINGATVEVWDAYPGGSILNSGATSGAGVFSVGAVGSTFDLRVRKDGYYPTVVRDLPGPTTNALVALVEHPLVNRVETKDNISDLWDSSSTFLNARLRLGDIVEASDPRGTVCGVRLYIPAAPTMYTMHVLGDNHDTPQPDGPLSGDVLSMTINGLAATPDSTPKFLANGAVSQLHLTGATAPPGITLTGELEKPGKSGHTAQVPFVVVNTGSLAGSFTVEAEMDLPWALTVHTLSGLGLTLSPGEVANIAVGVEIPPGTPDTTVELRVKVKSDTYGSANSGAWTMLAVTTISDIGGGGNGLVPDQFALAQNYPNPFNPATEIAYSLRVDGMVRLDVINLLGQNVRTLVDGYRSRGTHSEYWDGRDHNGATVPSGIYFYRLTQNAASLMRKMVLLK